jgi:hypothetical protein
LSSTKSATDDTPVLVHFSSIIVGALHDTGEGGVTVYPLKTLAPEIVVPVPPVVGGVVDVVVGPVLDVVDAVEEVVAELETVVDDGGVVLFLSLLHAANTLTASAQASAGARRGPRRGPARGGVRTTEGMKREATTTRLRILVRDVRLRRYRAEQCQRW